MADVTSIIEGLQILSNYTESEFISANNGEIAFEVEDIEIAPVDEKTLNDLGWYFDPEEEVWKVCV